MTNMKLFLVAVGMLATFLFSALPGQARAVHAWSADQLNSRSSLICIGTVTSIKQIGHARQFDYDGMKCSEVIMLAKIHVTRVLKGNASGEIDFRYRAVEPPTIVSQHNRVTVSTSHFVVDGPRHIMLAMDMNFRFFLTRASDFPGYVSVMDGDPDDTQSVSLELDSSQPTP